MKNYLPGVIGLALFFILSGCNSSNQGDTDAPTKFVLSDTMLSTTTTAPVRMESVRKELNLFGKITVDQNKLIEVFPVVGGSVVRVFAEFGDYVQKGQVLATIRSNEVAGYEKELQDAENTLLVGKNKLKVTQELFEGKLNTERDVIEAKSEVQRAESGLKRIQQTFSIYGLKPGSLYEVKAPISGFIIEKKINQDMQLRSDHTDNIFDIATIDDVWALANVTESIIGEVKVGMDAFVTTVSYPDKIYTGKIDKIFNIIDPETKAMKVRIKLQNKDYLLKPEMRASIKLSSMGEQQKLAIPSKALIFDKSRNYVMIYKGKTNIETRQVEIYSQVGDVTYIESGLDEGELVITHNQLFLYDALND